jgi:replication fork protection complex subunit Tof1/Swi1
MRAIKSDLYVHDSDDASDEEKDRLFFDREAQLRKDHSERVLEAMRLWAENDGSSIGGSNSKNKKRKSTGGDPTVATKDSVNRAKGNGAKRRKQLSSSPGTESEDTDLDSCDSEFPKTREGEWVVAEEDMPLSSPRAHTATIKANHPREGQQRIGPHSTDSSPIAKKTADWGLVMEDAGDGDENEDGNDDIPVVNAVRRRQRIGGFMVDGDSD